jgi:hypothetical protein
MPNLAITVMSDDGVALPTPVARRRELVVASAALAGILAIGASTWAATTGGEVAAGDALSPILDSIHWAFSAN